MDEHSKIKQHSKITVDIFSKPIKSFTYIMPSTCFSSNNMNNVPGGIALRFKSIYDSDKMFTVRSNEYKIYLIARDYKPNVAENCFREISKLSRQIKPKQQANNQNLFATTYNSMLPNMRNLIKKHLPALHSRSNLEKHISVKIYMYGF